jgi:hypothetical protein
VTAATTTLALLAAELADVVVDGLGELELAELLGLELELDGDGSASSPLQALRPRARPSPMVRASGRRRGDGIVGTLLGDNRMSPAEKYQLLPDKAKNRVRS